MSTQKAVNRMGTLMKPAKAKTDNLFTDNLGRMMGPPPPRFWKRAPYEVSGGKQTVIVVEPQYVDAIASQFDKHHMFARPKWRNGDTKDDMEVLWLKRTPPTVPQDV